MNIDSISLVVIGVIYFLALVLAARRRKTFPLPETLPIILIVGIGFTGIVYQVVPASPILGYRSWSDLSNKALRKTQKGNTL